MSRTTPLVGQRPVPTRMLPGRSDCTVGVQSLRVHRPRPWQCRANLIASQPTFDERKRIGIGRLATKLGWEPGDDLVLTIRGSSVQLERADTPPTPGNPTAGYLRHRSLDIQRRITLPNAACYVLGTHPGQQVQAIADLDEETLTLTSLPRLLELVLNDHSDNPEGADD